MQNYAQAHKHGRFKEKKRQTPLWEVKTVITCMGRGSCAWGTLLGQNVHFSVWVFCLHKMFKSYSHVLKTDKASSRTPNWIETQMRWEGEWVGKSQQKSRSLSKAPSVREHQGSFWKFLENQQRWNHPVDSHPSLMMSLFQQITLCFSPLNNRTVVSFLAFLSPAPCLVPSRGGFKEKVHADWKMATQS